MSNYWWQVQQFHVNGTSTVSLYETRTQAEFAAGRCQRAVITQTNQEIVVSPWYVDEQQKWAERGCAAGW